MPEVCYWESGGVRYGISALAGAAGAWLSAIGPGSRIRATSLPFREPEALDWLVLPEPVRTERAEALLLSVPA